MLSSLAVLLCLTCEPVLPVATAAAEPVDVELVLAVDVSGSMDFEEQALQREGYVEALKDPAFLKAVQTGIHGKIALTYFEWAGTPRPDSILEWQIIDGPESAAAFSDALSRRTIFSFRGTSISGALEFASGLLDRSPARGIRRVIDVSGDGANNSGPPVVEARDALVQKGIIINGLPILVRPSQAAVLDRYYADCVVGGPGSFVLPVRSASEFKEAIRRKLILEVSGNLPRIIPVQSPMQANEPTDCLIGEKQRRFYSDPYSPNR